MRATVEAHEANGCIGPVTLLEVGSHFGPMTDALILVSKTLTSCGGLLCPRAGSAPGSRSSNRVVWSTTTARLPVGGTSPFCQRAGGGHAVSITGRFALQTT